MPITMHAYAGPADIRPMQQLIQRQWRHGARHHIGAFAWERAEHYQPSDEWPTMLWRDGDDVRAWAWIYERDPDLLYFEYDRSQSDLLTAVFDWFERTTRSDRLAIPIRADRADLVSALSARHYQCAGDDQPFGLMQRRALSDLPPVKLPAGYRARSMAEGYDLERRARVHRAAWDRISGREGDVVTAEDHTRRMAFSRAQYANVRESWPYRADLDWVIEAPDGRWVASCIMWCDEANKVGVLEPVGVDADERRRGLGAGVCTAALHALRDAGADLAMVGSRGDGAYPVPRAVYQSIGFKPFVRDLIYQRDRKI